MKTPVYLAIALRIIVLCSIAMLHSYLPEQQFMKDFFADYTIEKPTHMMQGFPQTETVHEWGIRHYWYVTMTVLLFLLSILDAIFYIARTAVKHYPSLKNI